MKDNFDLHKWKEYQLFLNEQEEFSLGDEDFELAKSFNVKYLKIGSTITPEMWDQDKIKSIMYTDIDFNEPYRITNFDIEDFWEDESGNYWNVFLMDSDGEEIYELLGNINLWLKPGFKIEEQLDESFELTDDDLELAKSFNVKELEVGDNITPKMWDPNKIKNIAHTDINFNNINRITKIQKIQEWWDEDEDDINVWEVVLIDFAGEEYNEFLDNINMWLKPQYNVIKPLYESFELTSDDLELAKGFNDIYLGKGDTIEAGVISSEDSYYIVGFKDNSVLLRKNNSEYVSTFPIDMVQRKMEKGYILDPYKK